ncbi:unnamed protein product [Paramecium sonneborni]|uniref:Transmembrane protein n=1 Tax=Paramecium sonneborni TaxID=65129 RepID=A0A8S1PXT7_9CILI|nr:unnamed protein product [Paramecium sonneborni]
MNPQLRQSQNQEKLLQISRSQNIKLLKHVFQLFMIMESFVIITQIFMLSYYKLYTPNKQANSKLWISYYYSCNENQCFQNKNLCSDISLSDQITLCLNTKEFNVFRYILSSLIILIILFMIFDIYRMMIIKNQLKNEKLDFKFIYKAKKYQITIIFLLTLQYVILFIYIFGIEGDSEYGLGSAFYVGLAGFLSYLIVIIYFRYLKGRFTRESYLEKLLNEELNESDLQQSFEFKSIEFREERFYSIQDRD